MHFVISATGPTDRTRAITRWACRLCVEVRGLPTASLDPRITPGGMNGLRAAASQPDARMTGH